MIVLNNFPTKTDALGDKKVETIMFPSSKREAPVISPPKLDDDSRKVLLDKSITFLQKQHESMLKGLHQEIESLKRINKDLQYRLVMCTCSAGYSDDYLPQNKTKEENSLKQEISILREDLENERKKNARLMQQLEELQVSQNPVKGLPRFACKNGRLSTYSEQKNISKNDEMFQSLNKSQTHHDNSEFLKGCQDVSSKNTDFITDTVTVNKNPIAPTTGTLSVNKLIPTTSHSVPNKSSTTLSIPGNNLLTKRSILHSYDNEHVFEKQEEEIIESNDELINTHLLPFRLPALSLRKPLIQASLSNEQYKINTNNTKHSPTRGSLKNEETFNSELKITRPIRSATGHNNSSATTLEASTNNLQTKSIGSKTSHDLQQQLHDLNLRKVTQAYSIGLKPFLPSLTKPADVMMNRQNDRHQKKSTKSLHRKRAQQNIQPF
uniref:CCDC92 domain-containing protein n=1 Tax=Schistosoma mansoni TaxID=6183 RepID=A0A3Q0KDW9_SCHMA